MHKKKRVLITGNSGFLGRNVVKKLQNKDDFVVFGVDVKNYQGKNFYTKDVSDYQSFENAILTIKPDVIIHLAALKSLDECENNPEKANKNNYLSTKNICNLIKKYKLKCHLIFISSDYVFDGERGDYKENDLCNPNTVYGENKYKSEIYIKDQLDEYTICRTSSVFGEDSSFIKFISDNGEKKNPIEIYIDAMVSPTYIDYFVNSIDVIIRNKLLNIIHIAGKESISRYDFATKINKILGLGAEIIPRKILPESLIAKNSTLNSEYSQAQLGCYNPSIDQALNIMVNKNILPYFFLKDNRGIIKGICNDYAWEEINYISTKKDKIRGNHFHENTIEGIYITDGSIKVDYFDLISKEQWEAKYKKNEFFIIKPYINHTFFSIEDSTWINFLTNKMSEKKDIHRIGE